MSYIFYASWDYRFISLMIISTLVDFYSSQYIEQSKSEKKRKLGLWISLITNLGLLGFFKYFNLITNTTLRTLSIFGVNINVPLLNIILPVGISFYTFQTLSYTIDVYNRKIKPTKSILEFACYVSLFPQLVAGPIVRFSEITKDLENIDNINKTANFFKGLNRFILGLAKKIIIADSIALIINPMLENYTSLGFITSWTVMLGYTFQIYFDFSGYSDMAIGLGHFFGFTFPNNFNSPYKAASITDFWRRWHLSLSKWLKDYLYIGWLGGNKKGKIRTYINLIITMLLGGLWHGANWTFVIWGLYHGVLLAAEKRFQKEIALIPNYISRIVTFILVIIGWVLFRSPNFKIAGIILKKMFLLDMTTSKIIFNVPALTILLILSGYITMFIKNTNEMTYKKKIINAIIMAVLFITSIMLMGLGNSPFLYYQF